MPDAQGRTVMGGSRDVEMMRTPDRWPMWPKLPLKRWFGGELQCAILVEKGFTKEFVFYGPESNLFMPPNEAAKEDPAPSAETLVSQGWMVD